MFEWPRTYALASVTTRWFCIKLWHDTTLHMTIFLSCLAQQMPHVLWFCERQVILGTCANWFIWPLTLCWRSGWMSWKENTHLWQWFDRTETGGGLQIAEQVGAFSLQQPELPNHIKPKCASRPYHNHFDQKWATQAELWFTPAFVALFHQIICQHILAQSCPQAPQTPVQTPKQCRKHAAALHSCRTSFDFSDLGANRNSQLNIQLYILRAMATTTTTPLS